MVTSAFELPGFRLVRALGIVRGLTGVTRVVLASASPARRALLRSAGIEPEVVVTRGTATESVHRGHGLVVRRIEHIGHQVSDLLRLDLGETARCHCRRTDANPRRHHRLLRIIRNRILIDGDMRTPQGSLNSAKSTCACSPGGVSKRCTGSGAGCGRTERT